MWVVLGESREAELTFDGLVGVEVADFLVEDDFVFLELVFVEAFEVVKRVPAPFENVLNADLLGFFDFVVGVDDFDFVDFVGDEIVLG